MEDPQMPGSVPPVGGYQQVPPTGTYPPPNGYTQASYPPPPGPTAMAGEGLSDTAAGALAYITIIPAIIFLIMEPYNRRPFVKFHAFQCLGLGVVWFCLGVVGIIPILGWIVLLLGSLALLICWVMSLVKASQGSYFKLPGISDFASKQSGYPI
jgi:uncharacterized membrane protein